MASPALARDFVACYNEDMENGLSAAVGGIQRAFDTNADRAKRIAASGVNGGSFTSDMAQLPSDGTAVSANAAVIKTQDQMLGSVLDMVG